MSWQNQGNVKPRSFRCGHCSNHVGSGAGWNWGGEARVIYICPLCARPNFFEGDRRVPDEIPGNEVAGLPEDIGTLYKEVRRCVSIAAYTSSVVTCRKMLANLAVHFGAEEGKTFLQYVEWLADAGYVPPNGKSWVDHVRRKGNEAAHEICLMSRQDAEDLITFLEMLLKFAFEFPARVPAPGTV